MSWWKNQKKIIILKCCLLLFYTTIWTISPSNCDVWQKVDVIGQLAMTSSVVGPRRSSKAVPKAKLTPKKGHGLCLVVCCLSDPLQLSESQWNHYIWEVHLAINEMHWKLQFLSAGISQQKGPNSPQQCPSTHCLTNASKVELTGLQSFASSTTSTWPIANWLPLL